MYHVQPEEVKRQIISAVADLKTDKALGFLYNAYDEADNWVLKKNNDEPKKANFQCSFLDKERKNE